MMQLRLSQLQAAIGGDLVGEDVVFTGISTDSRSIKKGQLYFALKGERFDGHEHVEAALAQGAAAAIVAQQLPFQPCLKVADTYAALGQLSHYWRARFTDLKVVALTGSSGKTTLKEMLLSIAKAAYGARKVHATIGNLNNHIGVPLTLAGLDAEHCIAIIEAGMNHAGEIAALSALIAPDVAIINNAGTAHIEYLGSRAAIAQAKAEIYSGLDHTGVACWNGDDAFAPYWQHKTLHHPQLCFGRKRTPAPHAVEGEWTTVGSGDAMTITTSAGNITVRLALIGAHQRHNALAAATASLALGIPLAAIQAGLESMTSLAGRGKAWRMDNGACLIDDSYNANPSSMKSAIELLSQCEGQGILVLGQMGELGGHSAALHQEVVQAALASNVAAILLYGPLYLPIPSDSRLSHFTSHADLIEALRPMLTASTTCLIKGSRTTQMETVLYALHPASQEGTH